MSGARRNQDWIIGAGAYRRLNLQQIAWDAVWNSPGIIKLNQWEFIMRNRIDFRFFVLSNHPDNSIGRRR